MAAPKPWTNTVWLIWFALQLLVILLVDAVPYYPAYLYTPPSSPLHFLQRLRDHYIATYNDPLVQWNPHGSPAITAATPYGGYAWILLFTRVELLFQLPVAAYGVYRLGIRAGGRRTSGADELLFLVYALETALSTAVCLNDVAWWDEAVYSREAKWVFWAQLYGPWFVLPSLMFVDMYRRILRRMDRVDGVRLVRKIQ